MKIGVILFLAGFFCLLIPNAAFAVNNAPMEKSLNKISRGLYKKISDKSAVLVMNFQNLDGRPSHLGDYLSEQVRVSLANMPKITVLDRKSIDVLLSERKLAESGLVDEKSAISFGKALGAKTVVYGTLTNLEKNIGLTIKIVDIEKGVLSGGQDYDIKKTGEVISFLKSFPDMPTTSTENKENDLKNYNIKVIRQSKTPHPKVEDYSMLAGDWDLNFPIWEKVMGPWGYEDIATYTFNFTRGEYGNDVNVIKSLAQQQASELGCDNYFYVSSKKDNAGEYTRVTYHCYRSRCYDDWKRRSELREKKDKEARNYWIAMIELNSSDLPTFGGKLSDVEREIMFGDHEDFFKSFRVRRQADDVYVNSQTGKETSRDVILGNFREYAAKKYIRFFQENINFYKKNRDSLLNLNGSFWTKVSSEILFPFPQITPKGNIENMKFHANLLSYLSANDYGEDLYDQLEKLVPCRSKDLELDNAGFATTASNVDPLAIRNRRGQ